LNFLNLIRWKNLVIIVVTMFLLRYLLLLPLLEMKFVSSQLCNIHFLLVVIATVLLAAAGYIINDVYDVEADKVNKPEKLIIEKFISIKLAENLNLILNALAVAIGVYLSFALNMKFISVFFLLIAGLLYFYSTTYKGQIIVGNIMVALFSALVPFMVLLIELPLLHSKYYMFIDYQGFNFNYIIAWFGFYSFFAFLVSLIREIVKDMEDFEGDNAYGKHTLPVNYGIVISKIVSISLVFIMIIFIGFVYFKYINQFFALGYIIACIVIPLIYVGWLIFKAENKAAYTKASLILKLIMIFGLLYVLFAKSLNFI
jgi:4-hydroxybenzoate polyprenyltransferase